MGKFMQMKSTLFIISGWVILFIVNKKVNIIPLLCSNGINKLNGEYYRFITGAMLHNDLIHLLVNCFALYWIGYYLERNIGSVKFLIFGILACILSEVIFLSIYSEAESSFGGSTFTFAFIGLILVLQFLRPELQKLKLGTLCGNCIFIYGIFSNIPSFYFIDITTVISHSISLSVGALLGILAILIIKKSNLFISLLKNRRGKLNE
ncbi:rhomboid family intramembrane serine protease [Clostridium sp.]|uniref:rhomboid family intramembrane serine protease n=1 Tax=Clostridium sp. TaxID=1506 RepID=UPI001D615A8D|nr:rhomboid family intramembrane serine protease [Clostridium sp.]MBS5987032.1 rhomboid family intramembrane serine protease [Clostridium sp.]